MSDDQNPVFDMAPVAKSCIPLLDHLLLTETKNRQHGEQAAGVGDLCLKVAFTGQREMGKALELNERHNSAQLLANTDAIRAWAKQQQATMNGVHPANLSAQEDAATQKNGQTGSEAILETKTELENKHKSQAPPPLDKMWCSSVRDSSPLHRTAPTDVGFQKWIS